MLWDQGQGEGSIGGEGLDRGTVQVTVKIRRLIKV